MINPAPIFLGDLGTMGTTRGLEDHVCQLPTFRELRALHGITLEQISNASFTSEKRISAFEATHATFLDVLDALLLAFSKLVCKRYIRQDIFFVPYLRSWSSEPPLEELLPEKPTVKELLTHYRLDAYLIHQATDVPFREVEEMLIGRPVKRELVEEVLGMISLYLRECYTTENVAVTIEEE
jgi:hypothetical protein